MITALRPMGEVVLLPREYPHSEVDLEQMADDIIALGEDTPGHRGGWPVPLSVK